MIDFLHGYNRYDIEREKQATKPKKEPILLPVNASSLPYYIQKHTNTNPQNNNRYYRYDEYINKSIKLMPTIDDIRTAYDKRIEYKNNIHIYSSDYIRPGIIPFNTLPESTKREIERRTINNSLYYPINKYENIYNAQHKMLANKMIVQPRLEYIDKSKEYKNIIINNNDKAIVTNEVDKMLLQPRQFYINKNREYIKYILNNCDKSIITSNFDKTLDNLYKTVFYGNARFKSDKINIEFVNNTDKNKINTYEPPKNIDTAKIFNDVVLTNKTMREINNTRNDILINEYLKEDISKTIESIFTKQSDTTEINIKPIKVSNIAKDNIDIFEYNLNEELPAVDRV